MTPDTDDAPERLTVHDSVGSRADARKWAEDNTQFKNPTVVGYTPPKNEQPGFYTIVSGEN